jgi:hypothetical protein
MATISPYYTKYGYDLLLSAFTGIAGFFILKRGYTKPPPTYFFK